MIGVHYTTVKPSVSTQRIFGVDVAVSSWLTAWFRYGTQEKFHFLIGDKKEWDEVLQIAARTDVDPARLVGLDRRYIRENLSQFTTIFRPNPDSHNLFWQREQLPGDGFAFCGLAHTISGIEASRLLEQYCLAPAEEWDAIISPSHAVKAVIRSFWDLYADYLGRRFGAKFRCPVQLPVIPLGIDTANFEMRAMPPKRAAQRQELGIADDDTVLLWVGRLSSAIKAHPLAMFQAAERAAELTGAAIHLVMVGYFMPDNAEEQFKRLAADFCRKVKVTFIASDDARFPDGLWAAGDIFLSLIDNMQESFGLTPIEAMAAGLPRVISDWNGYRDSVTDGEDGFLVPTLQPPPGAGEELSVQLMSERELYGGFLAKTSLSVAIDQNKAAEAIAHLVRDKAARHAMAEKARERARKTYDWKHIIPAYEELWKELAAQREVGKSGAKRILWESVLPQAPDPFTLYAAYPSDVLDESDTLTVVASPEIVKRLWSHEINVLALDVMLSPEDTAKLINYVTEQKKTTIGALMAAFPAFEEARMWRVLGWLIKLGILGRKAG